MERLTSLLKARVNIFGILGVNSVGWGSLFKQSGVLVDTLLQRKVDKSFKITSSTIDSLEEAMAIGDGDWSFLMGKYGLLSDPNFAQANIDKAQLDQLIAQQHALNIQQAQAQNAHQFGNISQQAAAQQPKKDNARLNERALQLLTLRLNGVKCMLKLGPDDFLICHCTTDVVYTFFVFKGKSGNVEEDINIFPSDKLLTQLRLIMA